MKISFKIATIILPLLGLGVMVFFILFYQIEIVERIYIVSPYIILYVTLILEKLKEARTSKKGVREKQKDIQYFFKNFIEWIDGGKERSSYLENFVLRKFIEYERILGISILKIEDLSPDERHYYTNLGKETEFYFLYKIFVLEGKYILIYSLETYGPDADVLIEFIKPKTYREDYKERKTEEIKTRNNMIRDLVEYVKKEHNLQLEYTKKSANQVDS